MRVYYHSLTVLIIYFLAANAQSAENSPDAFKLEQIMEIQFLKPEMRSEHEFTKVEGGTATIQVWRDLPPEPKSDDIECLGYQWLISGRGSKIGSGASEVFKSFPHLEKLTLRLVDLSFSTQSLDKKGKLGKKTTVEPYLTMSISRTEMQRFSVDIERVKKELRSGTESCLKVGRRLNMEKEIKL